MSKEQKIKWLVIVNPAASGGQGEQRWSVIQAYLHKSGIDFFYKKTTHRNHATHLAQEAIEAGCRHLIAVGGDGTGNEVVNGIFQQKKVKSTAITFALLPLGTGNDWIKTHQIPKDLALWVDCLKKGKTTI
ncbi:MAG TPA: diacylglycerol kinase family lipid kinase, partial [Phaeodactylibacter sp.]|nr:diacylglycerol kinase family lipid kinase [Phaeodactylibacter sp.]